MSTSAQFIIAQALLELPEQVRNYPAQWVKLIHGKPGIDMSLQEHRVLALRALGKCKEAEIVRVRTVYTTAIDVDIKDAAGADAICELVRAMYAGKKLLQRTGQAPKSAFLCRTDKPFKKKVLLLVAPGEEIPTKMEDVKHRIEILGEGQQVVVHGVHPDTGRPYKWSGGTPWEVDRSELRELTEAGADSFLADAQKKLEALGWRLFKQTGGRKRVNHARYRTINDEAMDNLSTWVPKLFPEAEGYHDGYRVSSTDLGRSLQEALSILPEGIVDFGVKDMGDPLEGTRTPVELVAEWHLNIPIDKIARGERLDDAARWLHKALGLPGKWKPDRSKGKTQVDMLLELADDIHLFRCDDFGYADVEANGHRETWRITKSKGFRDWLTYKYFKAHATAPNREALNQATDVIDARARFEGIERKVWLRVAHESGKIYLDLS
jgi:hypothetical protein